jgi:choline dehydrogenase
MRQAQGTYDYIIIGSGSAGAVIARRLSDDSGVSVLLIEAGPLDEVEDLDVPVSAPRFLKTDIDWASLTEPEPGLGGRVLDVSHGRVLGGSSSINSMTYLRGSRHDYDGWAEAGAIGWSWRDVLPYFVRCEGNDTFSPPLHGTGGPLSVSCGRSRHPLSQAFLDAAQEAGHALVSDLNAGDAEGVGFTQVTQRYGRRCSVATAYLRPVLPRPNLRLLVNAQVTRLVTEGTTVRGVELARAGGTEFYAAGREVVLAAGAYHTPQLLQLSGIGPADELDALGITVVADLPVGDGLQDHLRFTALWLSEIPSLADSLTPEAREQFLRHGTGPYTSNVGETAGYIRSVPTAPRPDVQVSGVPASVGAMFGVTQGGVAMAGWLTNPTSTGTVRLRDTDPMSMPRIRHDYLTTDEDVRRCCDGYRAMIDIAEQPSLVKVRSREPVSAPASLSDGDIRAWLRRTGLSAHHPCGSAGIGRVVDPSLRVLGIDGLRVADASVMPAVVGANINAAAIMIGEKAADLLRGITGRPAAVTPTAQG